MVESDVPTTERPTRYLVWVIVVAVAFVVAVVQIHFNEQRGAVMDQWYRTTDRIRLDDDAIVARLTAIRLAWMTKHAGDGPATKDPDGSDLAAILGPTLRPSRRNGTLIVTDRKTNAVATLEVSDGRWVRERHPFASREPVRPKPSRTGEAITALRRLAYKCGYGAWALLFVISLAARTRRAWRAMTHLMLGVAIVSTFLACLGPGYWQALGGNYGDDAGLGSFAIVVSVVCYALARMKPRRPDLASPDCADCGYNLTGNTSGVCPECGRPALRRSVAASVFADARLNR